MLHLLFFICGLFCWEGNEKLIISALLQIWIKYTTCGNICQTFIMFSLTVIFLGVIIMSIQISVVGHYVDRSSGKLMISVSLITVDNEKGIELWLKQVYVMSASGAAGCQRGRSGFARHADVWMGELFRKHMDGWPRWRWILLKKSRLTGFIPGAI